MPASSDPIARILAPEEVDNAILRNPYKPAANKVVVFVPPVEELSAGGIVIAGADGMKREHRGQVHGYLVAIGLECWREFKGTCDLMKVGQRVSFGRYEGRMPDNDAVYRVMNDLDIDCVVDESRLAQLMPGNVGAAA